MKKYTTVDEFMDDIDEKQIEQIKLLRSIILGTHPELIEHIKWNSPSYILDKDDRITFSIRPNYPISVVFHMGTARPENKNGAPVMEDSFHLIEWKSDIRGIISFTDLDDIKAKRSQLTAIIDQWLKIST